MTPYRDHPISIALRNQTTRTIIRNIDRTLLLVSCKTAVDAQIVDSHIATTSELIRKSKSFGLGLGADRNDD